MLAILPRLDTTYLNKTANKDLRSAPGGTQGLPVCAVWHETQSAAFADPHVTLRWNLPRKVGSSYNYLIARDGTIFWYVDERRYVAWHGAIRGKVAGVSIPTVITLPSKLRLQGYGVNVWSIGVELDGPCNGTPITGLQRDSAIALVQHFRAQYGIQPTKAFHYAHKELALPWYRTDPRGYSVDHLLRLAA